MKKLKSKKICVITGSRADYGLLKNLIVELQKSKSCKLQLVVTGMHLSNKFGKTVKLIEKDGFKIDWKVDMLLDSDTARAVSKSMGMGLSGFADAFDQLAPDMVVILGDRFEMLAVASAALIAGIPIAHLHGGELTEGAYDDEIRHAITKMSSLHFTAAREYRNRVIQMGEPQDQVWVVGGFGIDEILNTDRFSRLELEQMLDYKFREKNLLVTFHPETSSLNQPAHQMSELLKALAEVDYGLIFTLPNADNGGEILSEMITKFVKNHSDRACAHTSLGSKLYLSTLSEVDGVVGNSSSGVIEAPVLKKGTVNIGLRQHGRLKASSIIDCSATQKNIYLALKKLASPRFLAHLSKTESLYGEGGAAKRTVEIIEKWQSSKNSKRFIDIH